MIKYPKHNNETELPKKMYTCNFQNFSNYVTTILNSHICDYNAIKLIILNF